MTKLQPHNTYTPRQKALASMHGKPAGFDTTAVYVRVPSGRNVKQHMNSALAQLHSDISFQLEQISRQLPEGYKLTLVARNVTNNQAGIVLSEDDLDKAIEEITRVKNNPRVA